MIKLKTIETINDRVKRLRAALNKSQKDFGASLGIKPNSVSDIETGKNKVTEQNIKAICLENWDGKKMFSKELIEDEYMSYVTEIGNGASDIVKKAIIKYGRLSPQDRKIIDNAIALAVKMIKEE